MIPIPGDYRESAQLAQDGGAPAAGELAASEAGQQDVPVAPAGDAIGNDSAAGPQPDGPGAAAGDQPEASQLAALPEPGAPAAIARNREPIVDFMRIDPDGKAVVAGRAAPGTELTVLDNGEPLGTITADIYGLWTFVSKEPLASGRHEIGLRVKRQGSEVSREPVLVTDSGSPLPLEPEATAGAQDPVTGAPDRQDFPQNFPEDVPEGVQGSEQLAAVAPETPVQSDASAPQSPDEQAGAEDRATAEIPAQPAETAAEPAQAVEQAPGESEPAAENTATPPVATATSTVPAPAPKPEPPGETQIAAAAPAGGDYVIQFASFLKPETAVREQGLVEEQFSDLLAGHEIFVQQVDIADQGTFYRVRLGPFASLAEARATCARFQERDRDCLAMAR
jgi:cell division protein FtsN